MNNNKPSMCFPFCSDLGNKEIYYLDSSWQPTWQLYTINHPNWFERTTDATADTIAKVLFEGNDKFATFYEDKDEEGKDIPDEDKIKFPRNIFKIEKYKDFWTGFNKKEIILFLAPKDFYDGKSIFGAGTRKSDNFYEKPYPNCRFYLSKEDYTTNDPTSINPDLIRQANDNFTKYSHLSAHSTFQFLFCHNVLFPANLKYLDFRQDENGEWYINYHIKVKATPGGVFYTFYSKTIFCQWKVEVKQKVPSAQTLKAFLKATEIVVKVVSAFTGMAAIGATATGAAEGTEVAVSKAGEVANASQQVEILKDGQETKSQAGRWGKTTDSILPNMTGQSDQVSYTFTLFDFWSKLRYKPIWGKIITSNNLINNLKHNNNANPITYPLNITFTKLAKILS
ncbi:hypothetical protein [endosymbiont GvMRE of Glomus versiforme]|uniref:hypothetical protein n=1 Tax=endosymbiont GvMRE of Glomus versiforme TaxID=2039283 RepID=UPI000EDFF8A0|nr:hypothetical protein [endosymbiont GvMRE of Glomus versiforme]RHZ35789.1 hypothetical protein GvMRE_Ic5g7 [endosymbiont GvMRE of Glomus versiforme]